MSGGAVDRVAVVTSSARSLPALMYSIDPGMLTNDTCTCPPSRTVIAHASLSADWYKADNVLRFSDEGETFMARFVEMPIAGGQQGQNVIVNIDLVRYIRSVKTGQATVYFDDDQSLTVAMDAQQIAEAANGA